MRYENSAWDPVSEFPNNFQFKPPKLSSGLDLKAYVGPRLTLMVYNVVGPHIDVNAYLKLEADPFDTPWWKLYGGLEAPLGVKVVILGRSLADYQTVLTGVQVLLAQARTTTRVSIATNGIQGNDYSYSSSISADGRYVAFMSSASNLVSGDINGTDDIFVHDRQTGQTSRVSVTTDGTQGNDSSDRPAISGDGRYVVFESSASNLVSGDTNGYLDVFVHDRQIGQTSRVSVASDGTQGNDFSKGSSISADGRYVAFMSSTSNLVSGDTNNSWDTFVHDRQTGQTSRVSIATDGTQGNYHSFGTSISNDGRYVTFVSIASNLVT